MTKSTITREQLLEIIETDHVQCGEASYLARMALAAMDSEPVAEVLSNRQGNDTSTIDRALPVGTQLYRHAQPAPVVQCPFPCGWDNLNKLAIQDAALVARGLVEGELTTEAHRQAAISNNDRLLKVISACRAAMLQAGNSPAQSDCCPAQNSVNPAQGGNSLVIPDEMTSGQAYEIGYYYGDPVDVFARGANWMRQPIIDSTLAAAQQEVKGE